MLFDKLDKLFKIVPFSNKTNSHNRPIFTCTYRKTANRKVSGFLLSGISKEKD
jgi:hypothetical protein